MQRVQPNLHVTVIGVAALLVVGGVFWFGLGSTGTVPEGTLPQPPTSVSSGVTVHVSGAVLRPGLVVVPPDARVADAIAAAGGASHDAVLDSVNLAEPVRDGGRISVPRAGDAVGGGTSTEAGVDVNTASQSDLTQLPGVGPVLAQRIVDHRTDAGLFRTVEDLLDVAGIGEAKLATMRPHISNP
ncbi:MAG: ComEA family DNA-binding protein [Acidimicrobiia bacterium]